MSASLIFGGDVAPLREDPSNMFGELAQTIGDADLAVANLEFALSDRGAPLRGKIYPHKGPASALAALAEARFDAVNLANNHMLDYGEEPLLDTLEGLAEAGIAGFGAGRNAAEAARPVVLERGGLKIGLLGFTTTLPTGFAATDAAPGVDPLRHRWRQSRSAGWSKPAPSPRTSPALSPASRPSRPGPISSWSTPTGGRR